MKRYGWGFIFVNVFFAVQGFSQVSSWPHLNFAIYFTARDIDSLLSTPERFEKTMAYFAPVKPVHVYLEGKSYGEIPVDLLKSLTKKFHSMGIRVSGGVVPVGPQGPLTYHNPEHLEMLAQKMQTLANVFDDIIIDDWLFTTAVDPQSVKERGSKSWAKYRTDLLLRQSQKYMITPARKVNPKVKITIKYPNWYEGFPTNGYDVYRETRLFDSLAVGIETRNRMIHDQHIPIYSGYVFQKWYASVAPSKWVGCWLDNYEMKGNPNDYNAQVWQAVLAQAPEIILWCAGQLYPTTGPSSDVYPYFCEMLETFDRVRGMLAGKSRGIPMYLPYGSTGEYNIFGYLGMIGIPIEPVGEFPLESENAIFTLHSLKDRNLAKKMLARLENGKDVFMTWSLWQKLQETEFKNTLNLVNYGGTVSSDLFRLRLGWFRQELVQAGRPFTFPRIETMTWPYVRDVALVREDYDFGVFLNVPYLNGTLYILNVPDNSYDLLRLPAPVLNTIRRAFVKDLGVELNGAGGVALYMFGEKQYVLYNMSDELAEMKLRFYREVPKEGWRERVKEKPLPVELDSSAVRFGGPALTQVSVSLKPFEIAVVEAR